MKIRGYRIELSAISAALTGCPGVHDAVVTVTKAGSAGKRLVAAVVPEPGATVVPAQLRDSLSDTLPSYMVPALWAVVDRVPVTANGKVDRRALAALAAPAGKPAGRAQPAGDEDLARVLALFAEVIEPAGAAAALAADSDFFAAGGNSLAAVRLVALAKQRLGISVRLPDFLLSPTPAGLCRLVKKAEAALAGTAGAEEAESGAKAGAS